MAVLGAMVGGISSTRVRHLEAPPFLGIPVGGGELEMHLRAVDDARRGAADEYQLWARLERVCGAFGCAGASARAFVRDDRLSGVLAGDRIRGKGTLEEGDGMLFLSLSGRHGSVLTEPRGHPVARVRRYLVDRFARRTAHWPRRVRGVFSALFAGDRSALPPSLERAMRGAGAAHILALSGMHLGILSAAVYGLVRKVLGVAPARVCVCVFAGVYLIFAGPRPSLVRAVIMLWIASATRARDRTINLSVILSLSFLVHALVLPADLMTLAFQLSFLSLLGLLILAAPVYGTLPARLPRIVKGGFAAGLAAQTATAPLVFITFGVMHPAGVLASILLTPVAVGIIAFGIIALVLEGIAPLVLPALVVATEVLYGIASVASALPSLERVITVVAFLWVIPCLLGLSALRYRWHRRRIRRALNGLQRLYSNR
ncbi:MAG: ComEC/Rec2 family competence protein [bacterium]